MKRIWIFLMAMLCIVSFTGCDKTDEPNGPDMTMTICSIGLIQLTMMAAVCSKVASQQELQLLRMR